MNYYNIYIFPMRLLIRYQRNALPVCARAVALLPTGIAPNGRAWYLAGVASLLPLIPRTVAPIIEEGVARDRGVRHHGAAA